VLVTCPSRASFGTTRKEAALSLRGRFFVRAQDSTGRWGPADIMDLDEESFRFYICERVHLVGVNANEPPGPLRMKEGVTFEEDRHGG
jgi:hypothetical protein